MNPRHTAPIEVKEPPAPTPLIELDVLASIDPQTLDDSCVYVHCHCSRQPEDFLIRIWRTTFLMDAASHTRSQLIHAEKITFAPRWTLIPQGMSYSFLLIFSGLPKDCKRFDLIEEIAQEGGFHIKNMSRNETDVYHTDIL
jgi:hypothetical protein